MSVVRFVASEAVTKPSVGQQILQCIFMLGLVALYPLHPFLLGIKLVDAWQPWQQLAIVLLLFGFITWLMWAIATDVKQGARFDAAAAGWFGALTWLIALGTVAVSYLLFIVAPVAYVANDPTLGRIGLMFGSFVFSLILLVFTLIYLFLTVVRLVARRFAMPHTVRYWLVAQLGLTVGFIIYLANHLPALTHP